MKSAPGIKTVLIKDDGSSRDLDFEAGRRAFIRSLGLAAAGAAFMGAAATAPFSEAQAQSRPILDSDFLNFALNLEYLEAEYYLRAAYGRGLADADITGMGTLGGVSGGRLVPWTDPVIRSYANEIANDEEAHVKLLRAALGDARVARPAIDLNQAFTSAALGAGLITAGQTFDPFANETNFLLGAYIFEDVGVTAYKGAAPFIVDKGLLSAAAGLLAVEAYHAGEVRTLLYARGLFTQSAAISDLRDSADGTEDFDQGIGTATVANIVPTDANGLAFSRLPHQVLNIVYLNPNTMPGGFLPNGMNGLIR